MKKAIIVLVLLTAALPGAEATSPDKAIAITVDDLPGGRAVREGQADQTLRALAAILTSENVPATGFVIGELASRTADAHTALESWAAAGLALGNHTWNHAAYSEASPEAFWEEVGRTERLLEPLRKQYGWPATFRFPMLDHGKDDERARAAGRYLEETATLLAHVSVDTSDWAFIAPYDEARESKDTVRMARIEQVYAEHIRDCVEYAENASAKLFARQIPQILLLHCSTLNVAALETLLKDLRARGYRFISLSDALDDPAYQSYRNRIVDPAEDHFFAQVARATGASLPEGPDRTSYAYFLSHWKPKLH